MQTCIPKMKSRLFSLNSELPRILPFRHIHLLLCLVSHRLFILAFISAITAMLVRSLQGKWKTAVILRCRVKVSTCSGSLAHCFLCASLQCWYILYCTVHIGAMGIKVPKMSIKLVGEFEKGYLKKWKPQKTAATFLKLACTLEFGFIQYSAGKSYLQSLSCEKVIFTFLNASLDWIHPRKLMKSN